MRPIRGSRSPGGRPTGILRQGKPGLRAPLAGDPQARVGPIDVRQTQIPNVAGAQGQAGEEKHDGPVT